MLTIECLLVYLLAYGSLIAVVGVALYMIWLEIKEHRGLKQREPKR